MGSLVSIIVPCYNGEKYIDRCFNSILRQCYSPLEVIVVNDGSTDHSENGILSWKKRFDNAGIQLVYISQENQGLGGAINTGLKAVSGDYLSLLDVDDEFLDSAITTRVKFLEENMECDVVRSNGWYNRTSGKSLFICDESEKNIEDVFSALVEGKTNNWAGSYMVRTSALFHFYPDRDIFTSRYGQNLQLLMPLVYRKRCGFIDEPQMNYNIQEDSLSITSDVKKKPKLIVDNVKGYRDIRLHMISEIVNNPKEAEKYTSIVNENYCRSLLEIATEYNIIPLAKNAYSDLKKYTRISLNDRITYCSIICPCMVFPLRCIRKIASVVNFHK